MRSLAANQALGFEQRHLLGGQTVHARRRLAPPRGELACLGDSRGLPQR
jgi:hypothetical protein